MTEWDKTLWITTDESPFFSYKNVIQPYLNMFCPPLSFWMTRVVREESQLLSYNINKDVNLKKGITKHNWCRHNTLVSKLVSQASVRKPSYEASNMPI